MYDILRIIEKKALTLVLVLAKLSMPGGICRQYAYNISFTTNDAMRIDIGNYIMICIELFNNNNDNSNATQYYVGLVYGHVKNGFVAQVF